MALGTQSLQNVLPGSCWYLPIAHNSHLGRFTVRENCPALHVVQVPCAMNFPGLQSWHVPLLEPPQPLRLPTAHTAHAEQLIIPVCAWYELFVHFKQRDWPAKAEYLPTSHCLHISAFFLS